MRGITKTFVLTFAACILSGAGQARPVTLTCSDSVDLYAHPYTVVVDSKNMTVQIIKATGPLAGRHSYPITQVNSASDGGYVVTANGRVLNSRIQVMVSADEKWVDYSDALTNQAFTMDYCN